MHFSSVPCTLIKILFPNDNLSEIIYVVHPLGFVRSGELVMICILKYYFLCEIIILGMIDFFNIETNETSPSMMFVSFII